MSEHANTEIRIKAILEAWGTQFAGTMFLRPHANAGGRSAPPFASSQ
jgi:hypothetical protein